MTRRVTLWEVVDGEPGVRSVLVEDETQPAVNRVRTKPISEDVLYGLLRTAAKGRNMKANTMVAVYVVGEENLTRITGIRPLCNETLGSFAKVAASRQPGRLYYVVECSERGAQRRKGDPLYAWHVGDGFDHAAGWWTETE